MRILLLLSISALLIGCASSNPRSNAPTTPQAVPVTRTVPMTTTQSTPAPERRGTTDPGTRWMPVQPLGALAAETSPRPPSRVTQAPVPAPAPAPRPALMPGTPPGTPADWTTPPSAPIRPLGDPPAGTGLPKR